jgi:hypothetical protein
MHDSPEQGCILALRHLSISQHPGGSATARR